jgi:hypothetical protein
MTLTTLTHFFKKNLGVFLGDEDSQMQLIGDFYTSLGVEQNLPKIGAIIILPSLL